MLWIPRRAYVQSPRRLVAAPILLASLIAVLIAAAPSAHARAPFIEVPMTCFPPPPPPGEPPGLGPAPPCVLPTGLDPRFVPPAPEGRARLWIRPDGTARARIDLEGLAPDLLITAWASYFFPGGPAPHPIFAPTEGAAGTAAVSVPLAATTARFSEGLSREPNQLQNLPEGRAFLLATLDWNPLEPGEGPLRNGLRETDQADAPPGSGAEQPPCCPDLPAPVFQGVGASFLRVFDPATGFQRIGPDGRPELVRSPLSVAFIAVVVHIDETTHGISPGIPILPIPGMPATAGDHFLLGLFDLRPFQGD